MSPVSSALILHVASDADLLFTRSLVLQCAGHMVDSVGSVEEAIARLRSTSYDVLVLGHSVPQDERMRLIQLVGAGVITTPVIFVSTAADEPHADFKGVTISESHPDALLRCVEQAIQNAAKSERLLKRLPHLSA